MGNCQRMKDRVCLDAICSFPSDLTFYPAVTCAFGREKWSIANYANVVNSPLRVKHWASKRTIILTFRFVKPQPLIGQSEHSAAHIHRLVTSNLRRQEIRKDRGEELEQLTNISLHQEPNENKEKIHLYNSSILLIGVTKSVNKLHFLYVY